MRRPTQYGDSGVNPMMAAQMQHMTSQRMQYNSGIDEHQYLPSKAEAHWQWERGDPKGTKSMSPDVYKEGEDGRSRRTVYNHRVHDRHHRAKLSINGVGQRSEASRSTYHGQRPESKTSLEKQMGRDSRSQPHQDDKETGFEDINHPPTFEGLEEKFLQDMMKLSREQYEAEDKENSRHKERLIDINTQYQEKLAAIRARQAALRDEFLRLESQARHQQYQQSSVIGYQKSAGPRETYGYGPASADPHLGGPHQAFGRGNFESYGEQPEFAGDARIREFESRGQYPGGRAYSSGGRYY